MLFTSGLIFGYYLWDVRREFSAAAPKLKYFIWFVCGLVLAIVVAGFFLIGSPAKKRISRFDQQRINNLQSIQFAIVNYWTNKRVLPENFSVLEDPISGYKTPTDPQTNETYEYNVKGNESFELCAVFGLPSDFEIGPKPPRPVGGDYNQNWDHIAGRVCFERKIDQQLYPPPK